MDLNLYIKKKWLKVGGWHTSLLIVLILSIPSQSHADDKIVVTHGDLEYSAFQLMAKRILTPAYSRIGISVKFEKLPNERSLVNANRGITDGVLGRVGGLVESYPNLIMIPIPIAYDEILVYSKKINFKVEGWNSLLPHKIGYVSGFKKAELKTVGMEVETVTSPTQGLHKLNLGRTDLFIGIKGIQCLINRLELSEIGSLDQPLEKIIMYHYVHKSHGEMAARLETVLRQMKESGEMDLLQKQSRQDFLIQCN
ncbi:hypothetical protein [uncultured Cocleimonas sp.]|uniref:hypothetical protein n=1 Tax=uncultured Cocleimonas sp. TaxID=1051587 RepID=UPI002622ABA5|nr:hypothetical protein [uncultured Cocleimonas sp.]